MRKMRNLFLCCLLILCTTGIRAQDDDPVSSGGGFFDNLSYGVKAGIVSSTFASQGQKLESLESRTGLAAGIFGEYKILDYLGATVEVNYVQEGAMRVDPRYVYYYTSYESNAGAITKENSNILLHNIEIPVLVNYYLPDMGDLKVKAFAGASFDFILMAKAKNLLSVQFDGAEGQTSLVLNPRASDDITSSFEYYSIGAVIGTGVTYDMFTLDVLFKLGVTPINNLATYNYNNGGNFGEAREDIMTNTLMIRLGVNLNELF